MNLPYDEPSDVLTSKACTSLECLNELRPHLNHLVLALLELLPPLIDGPVDHLLDGLSVLCVEHITDPFLVQVVPVLLIREELEQRLLLPRMVEEVLDCQPLDLRHRCDLDCRSFDVLNQLVTYMLTSLLPLVICLRKKMFTVSILGKYASHSCARKLNTSFFEAIFSMTSWMLTFSSLAICCCYIVTG